MRDYNNVPDSKTTVSVDNRKKKLMEQTQWKNRAGGRDMTWPVRQLHAHASE